MSSRLEEGEERLLSRLLDRDGTSITIVRGAQTTTCTALCGDQLLRVETSDGTPQTIRTDRSFIIGRTDYVLGAAAVEPQRGDRIMETIDGIEVTYEVLPYADEPIYRWSGAYRKAYRVHAKRVK